MGRSCRRHAQRGGDVLGRSLQGYEFDFSGHLSRSKAYPSGDEDIKAINDTYTAIIELLQWTGTFVCASAEAKQHPQLSKPVGSRNADRQHQESSKRHEHSPRECSRPCNITRRAYEFSRCGEAEICIQGSRRPQHKRLPATTQRQIRCHISDR